jgi:NAD(P)-dependent dehydrogenase (short-subunit alcohol dehydrogenase family)
MIQISGELSVSHLITGSKGFTSMKVWFITGTSRGFGREWAEAALERGDSVAATARNVASLDDLAAQYPDALLPIALDVTDREAVFAAVSQAHERFGRIDVAVNNAGYGHFGAIEELTEAEARAQLETNVFGALWVTQAVLPIMRAQRSGRILQVSSIGGITAFPLLGMYHASKWALEGFSQSLAAEVAPYGVKVTLIEPTGYSTDWSGDSAFHSTAMPEYEHIREARRRRVSAAGYAGDPKATRAAVLAIVDADEPPLRIFFGRGPLETAEADYASRIETWEAWREVSEAAHGAQA